MTLQTRIDVALAATLAGAPKFGRSPIFDLAARVRQVIPSGRAAGQADRLFAAQNRTLAASAAETVDLAGVLLDPLGQTLRLGWVKAILVRAADTNVGAILVGGAGAGGFLGPFGDATDAILVAPGGLALLTAPQAGWPVADGGGDLLRLANGGAASVVYDLVAVGVSALAATPPGTLDFTVPSNSGLVPGLGA